MATQRVIGLYVLCILLVLFVIAIQCSSIATTEGFTAKKKAPPVPAYCGTHGYFNTNILNTKDVPKQRSYTQSQCDAIGGIMRNGYDCVKLKKIKQNDDGEYDFSSENIKMSYNEKCGGLNYQTTPRPSECGSVGKPNVEVKMTINGKKTTIPANSAILYTQDECENVLEGNFVNVQTVMDQQKKTRKELVALWGGSIQEFNKAIKDNGGEDMGLCNGVDNTQPNFSQACTGTAGLLGGAGSGAGGFFSWLKSFF